MCSLKSEVKASSFAVSEEKCTGKCKECHAENKNQMWFKTIGVTVLLFVISNGVFAQDPATRPAFLNDPFNDPMLPMYIIIAFILITIILVAFVGLYLIKIVDLLTVQAEKDRAAKLGVAYVPRQSWWSKFYKTVNASVPVEQEQTIELDHNYDGIKELDNHLPPWWKWLFIGTIVWSAVYIYVYHFSASLPLQEQEYLDELTLAEEKAASLAASQPQAAIDENTMVYSPDAEILASGSKVFVTNCVACHKADGGGNAIGPNITDAYWLHGGELKNIFLTIKNGVVEKGMPAWGKAMSPKEVRDVTFYVISLQGTNPPDAKAPQGNLFTPAPVKADTVIAQATQ
jgi:cytochrome c oxidase cbb3-type subunit III